MRDAAAALLPPSHPILMAGLIMSFGERALLLLASALIGGVVIVGASVAAVTVAGATPVIVTGASMAPLLPAGSLVVAAPVPVAEITPGDVLTFMSDNGTLVTHRASELLGVEGETQVRTKGDANPHADPIPVPASAVLGRVELAVPRLGYVVALLQTASGIFAAGSLLGSLLLARRALVLSRPARRRPAPTLASAPSIVSVLLVAAVVASFAGSSGALLSDTATVPDNTFTTGAW